MNSLGKFFKKNGFVGGVVMIIIAFAIIVVILNKFFLKKNSREYNSNMQSQYKNYKPHSSASSAYPLSSQSKHMPKSANPGDLLPKDSNSDWAQINPSGKGELANINLLKAGHHIGIDTVGQTLRNANLQIRSEPPNPQISVGPWNQSTITPDFMRPPLEIGCGSQ